MLNQDVTDLFERVAVGTQVVVLPEGSFRKKAARRRGRPSLGKKTPYRAAPLCNVTMGFASPIWEVTGAEEAKDSSGWPRSSTG